MPKGWFSWWLMANITVSVQQHNGAMKKLLITSTVIPSSFYYRHKERSYYDYKLNICLCCLMQNIRWIIGETVRIQAIKTRIKWRRFLKTRITWIRFMCLATIRIAKGNEFHFIEWDFSWNQKRTSNNFHFIWIISVRYDEYFIEIWIPRAC